MKLSTILCLVLGSANVLGATVKISNADEFIKFSNNVNNKVTYAGTTVLMTNDITFTSAQSKKFIPVGTNFLLMFRGTFDGQGYMINKLTLNSSSIRVGVFGFSGGSDIRNLVVGASCAVTSTYASGATIATGGIIGACDASSGNCNIKNNVNLARVTFQGETTTESAYAAGIVGECTQGSFVCNIKNNANYATIEVFGHSNTYVTLGGINGLCYGTSTKTKCNVHNNVNFGLVAYRGGNADTIRIGGISGYAWRFNDIQNCVNAGSIVTARSSAYIGAVVGFMENSAITHCYWTDAITYNSFGSQTGSLASETVAYNSGLTLKCTVTVGKYKGNSLVPTLNAYADLQTKEDCSKWTANANKQKMSFVVNGRNMGFMAAAPVVLLPNLAPEGSTKFYGWYTDAACSKLFTTYTISSDTTLYGKWN